MMMDWNVDLLYLHAVMFVVVVFEVVAELGMADVSGKPRDPNCSVHFDCLNLIFFREVRTGPQRDYEHGIT